MDWSAWRAEFPTLSRKTYLNTCSLGPLSRRARAAVNRYLDLWEEYGASAWYEIWLGEIQETRKSFARLVNASPDEIAILPNTSSALAVVASCLDYAKRPKVVTNALDFPTVPYQWRVRPGVDVVELPSADGVRVQPELYEAAVGPETAAVATTHVFFTTGWIQDAQRISRLAREAGALSVIDGYHSAGQLPVDVKEMGCDVFLSGGLKWLLGGTGIVYMYVRRELHERLRPTTTGWFGHARQFAFDPASFEFHSDARRFEMGSPANAAVYAGRAGLDIVNEVGPAAIRRRTNELVGDLLDRVRDAGYAVGSPVEAHERTGIVIVKLADAPAAVKALAQEGIIVDSRPGRMRVSPYFYNTVEENERFVDALRKAAPP